MLSWFNARKAAQIVAFFAREEGGEINVLKLSKLIYIADRKHMELHDHPMCADMLVSMNHGPVNSLTLEYVNGYANSRDGREEFVTDRSGYKVGLARSVIDDDLDELNAAEVATLHLVWDEFGDLDGYALRDWTHAHCPEWEDPGGSSAPIPYERVFKFLGKPNADELAERVADERRLRMALTAD